MSNGVRALRKIQLGKETTPGSAVAATAAWRGQGTIQDDREPVFVDEQIGILMPTDRMYVPKLGASLDFDSIEATFEQLPYILEAGIMACTPTTDTGSGYIYTYNLPTTAIPTIRTYTIEGGDNQEVEEIEYCFVSSFSLSGAGGEAVKVAASWQGRQSSTSTFTPSTDVTIPTVEEILFSKGMIYTCASSDTWAGSTTYELPMTLLDFNLDVNTGIVPKYAADGQLYFSFIQSTPPEVVLECTFEHNAYASLEKDYWRAKTTRKIQVRFNGSTLTSGGTYTTKALLINLIGKWESFEKLGEMDGNDVTKGKFRAGYNVTEATAGQIIIVNETTTLP